MKKCQRCKVLIENNVKKCPLCENHLITVDSQFEKDYPNIMYPKKAKIIFKSLLFISLLAVLVSVLINFMTKTNTYWSAIVLAVAVYLWVNIFLGIKSRKNIGFMVLMQTIAVSGLCYVSDVSTGYHKWSVNYVIPFIVVAATLFISIIVMIKPMLFRDFIIYQLVIVILSILALTLIWLKLTDVTWTWVASASYSLITFFGMFIFSDRKTKHELKKRFHF